jgi:hypothetical protein
MVPDYFALIRINKNAVDESDDLEYLQDFPNYAKLMQHL